MEGCFRMFSLLELWIQWAFESGLPLHLHFCEFSGPVSVREICEWVLSLYIQGLFKKMLVALHKQCKSIKDSPPLCGCQDWMLWELFSFFCYYCCPAPQSSFSPHSHPVALQMLLPARSQLCCLPKGEE